MEITACFSIPVLLGHTVSMTLYDATLKLSVLDRGPNFPQGIFFFGRSTKVWPKRPTRGSRPRPRRLVRHGSRDCLCRHVAPSSLFGHDPWTACCAMTSQAPCATLAHWTAMAPWSAQSAMNGCRSIQGILEGTPEHRDGPSERGGGWVNVSPVFPCLVFYSPCAFPMTYFLCRFWLFLGFRCVWFISSFSPNY